ncbi:MAG: hypothetical protein K0Q95_248 [Bacteroidota bacterium]|jgi:hypothetical protein|nr:hypothetical protein [Bacteroidota bacterium]
MLRVISFLLFLNFVVTNSFSQGLHVFWSAPLNVGSGSTQSNVYPRITLSNGDVPLVVWQDMSPAAIYSSRKLGGAFSTPVTVNPSGVSPFVANYAGAEVSSSGDTAFVVFTSMPMMSGNAYAVRSIDGGASWSDTLRVDHDSAKIPNFPTVVVLPGGNPVVSYMIADDGTMANTEYVTSRSLDGGETFLPSVLPSNPGEVCECCPASMAVSGNDFALLYRNNISNVRDMWASFSTDQGTTFASSSEIDTTHWLLTSCPSSGPTGIIIGDTLIYSWMSSAAGGAKVYLGTVNIHDNMIGQHRKIYPYGTSTQNNPIIAGRGDTLGLVWLGYNGSFQDVFFTWSVTGAAGLGITVDTITKAFTGHQSRPDLEFKNGKFHLVFSNSVGTQVQYMEGTLTPALGLSHKSKPSLFEVFPNPAKGSINLRSYMLEESYILTIRNILGEQLMTKEELKGNELISIDVKAFPAGTYFVTMQSDKRISTQKVVIAE